MNNYKPHLTDECLLEKLNQIIDEGCNDVSDLLVLRLYHRIKTLEERYQANNDRIDKLNAFLFKNKNKNTSSFLVTRIATILDPINPSFQFDPVCDALRVIANEMRDWQDSSQMIYTAFDVAEWLEQEANQ